MFGRFLAGTLLAILLLAGTSAQAQMNSYGSGAPQNHYQAPPSQGQYAPQDQQPYQPPRQEGQPYQPRPQGQYGVPPQNRAVEPDQPVRPQVPTFEPRAQQQVPGARVQQVPSPPFMLNPQEEAQVDRVLAQWEQQNRSIKTFDCKFTRWIYDAVFKSSTIPKYVEFGEIRYATPDRGLFRLETSERDGRQVPIENDRAEHWICDGKSIFEFSPVKKQVIEHPLPKELQGKAIANSPLPFLFGSESQKLKQRYFIRIVTPSDLRDQIWLEAYPRFQQDAANFKRAIFVISTKGGMSPFGLEILQPNGKDFTRYRFEGIVVNDTFGNIFKGDPFKPFLPKGWQAVKEEATTPAAQASSPASAGRR